MGRKKEVESIELRGRILDKAEEIIREEGSASKLTIRGLAKVLELSPTTPYNMFGTKGELLKEIFIRDAINDSIKLGIVPSPDDTLEVIFEHIDIVVGEILTKSEFIKALLLGIMQQSEEINLKSISEMGRGLALNVVNTHFEKGLFSPDVDPDMVSYLLIEAIISNCFLWFSGVLTDEEVRPRIKRGMASVFYDHATPAFKEDLNPYIQ